MKKLKNSYLSVYPLLLLVIFPGIVRFAKIKSRHYTFDERNIHVEEGVFQRESMSIPLIKIESVQVKSNILGNGTVLLNAKVASKDADNMWDLEYVRNAKKARREIMQAIDNARDLLGVKPLDRF